MGDLCVSQECFALSEEMGKLKDFLTLPFASSHPQPLATTATKKGQGCTSPCNLDHVKPGESPPLVFSLLG